MNFTALGDVVNLSARLEGATKIFGGTILCSSETQATAGDGFQWLRIARVGVKGKTKPEPIYEPLGFSEDIDAALAADVATYDAALALYGERKFEEAIDKLGSIDESSRLYPIAKLLVGRCMHFQENPPEADWDGVWWLDSK